MALRRRMMRKYTLYFAWLSSIVGAVFSLFLSEVLNWPICALCWYQRICLYPLAIILGIACFRSDNRIAIYSLPLTLSGIVFAGYQYLEQMIPGFSPIDVCGSGPSCSRIEVIWLGFITLPLISMVGFVVISWLLVLCLQQSKRI